MATITDPANELAQICKRFVSGSSKGGDAFMEELFGFPRYSTNFYRVLVTIMRRIDQVLAIVDGSDMDNEHKELAREALADFRLIFTPQIMGQTWNHAGAGLTKAKDNLQGITFLSRTVRAYVSYPALSAEEVKEMLGEIDAYLELLRASDTDLPFVRRAIEDSLVEFAFRLLHLGWLGADYTLSALRDVNAAYHGLERGMPTSDAATRPIYEGLGRLLSGINDTLTTVRGWKENSQMLIAGYSMAAKITLPFYAAGLLPALPAP